jgi:hypothetical protein
MKMESKPTIKDVSQLTIVANSVSHLAKLVSDLQSQLRQLDARLSTQETESLANYNQKKRDDFKDAYKGLVSIVRTLKMVPEIQDATKNLSSSRHQPSSGPDKSTNLLRTIAMTLNDVDTVASYVSNDDISLRGDVPQSVQFNSNDVEIMRQKLHEKEQQMEQMRNENIARLERLEQELLQQRKNKNWMQFIPVVLVLGSFGIANKEIINPTFSYPFNSQESDMTQESMLIDSVKIQPARKEVSEIIEAKENSVASEIMQIKEPPRGSREINTEVAVTDGINSSMDQIADPEIPIVNIEKIGNVKDSIIVSNDSVTSHECWSNLASQWLERNLCEELNDMMNCPSKTAIAVQKKKRLMFPSQFLTTVVLSVIIPSTAMQLMYTPILFSFEFWVDVLKFISRIAQ